MLSLLFLIAGGKAWAQTLADYTAYPPFVSAAIEPNVLIILDNSGSMNSQAYDSDQDVSNVDAGFNPNVNYYGYFNSAANYVYSANPNNVFIENPNGPWNGNFLNWLTMRRIDVAKKVLVGGKALSRSGQGNPHTLVGHVPPNNGACCQSYIKRYNDNLSPYYTPYRNLTRYYHIRSGRIYVDTDSRYTNGTLASFFIRVRISDEPIGVIQQIGDKVRWGLELYNLSEGGRIVRRVDFNISNLVVTIENVDPETWTPLAESFYEGVRYFQQLSPYYAQGDYVTNQVNDPYYYSNYNQSVRCCKSFALMITDGESTQDLNIPRWLQNYAGDGTVFLPGNGSDYLEDVALWAHTTDLRGDLAGTQGITLYTVFAFGSGSQLLRDAAVNGGFEDLDGNGRPGPDSREWDKDQDTVPDNYFEAQDGYQLEASLLSALADLLRRSSSGTSISVLSTTSEGEGAMYQAFFYPSRFEGSEEVRWVGFLHALFLDSMGNLREDSDENDRLDLGTDRIVRMVLDEATGETRVQRFADNNGDGGADSETPESTVPLDEIQPVWEAGEELAIRSAASRQIYTWADSDGDGRVAGGEFGNFDSSRAATLRPYLRAATPIESQMIIDFIRGENMPGYRNRSVTVNGSPQVWKLGDIVYSTPVTVGVPQEQYDLIYKDASYLEFLLRYKGRRNMVYVGSNDGMLHAFNAGFYDAETRSFDPGAGRTLGEELWAYVPHEVLPHLKWLTLPDYTHVYYVDLKPKVTDAKIFSEDADHPGGWGTVLLVGLRMGGGRIQVTDDFGSGMTTRAFQSAYFMLDVTNPEQPPKLLWSFTDADLGFTTSYPAVARVASGAGSVGWFAVMGSGPTSYTGEKAVPNLFGITGTTSYLYILDLAQGALLRKIPADSSGFMGDVVTLDGNLDYTVDTVYVGSSYKSGNAWRGRLYRLVTHQDPSPGGWDLSTLYSAPGPIPVAPSISVDSFANIWVYFGTGRFMSVTDKNNTDAQAVYGVKDPCWFGAGANCPREILLGDLVNVTDAVVGDDESVTGVAGVTTFNELLGSARSSGGWMLTLPGSGERLLAKPMVIGGILFFTTFSPNTTDVCAFQGESTLYAVYFETGSAYRRSVLGDEPAGGEIARSISLGEGVPTTVGLHLGAEEGTRGFVQQSTGAITEIDAEPAFQIKSGVVIWQEKRG
jgi:type IV pilus assembly protein PilY1